MQNWSIFICGFLICFACNKEPDYFEESIKYCKENFVTTCFKPVGMFNFTGQINGNEFCVSNGVNDYWMLNGVATESVTSTQSPVLSPFTPVQSTFYTLGFYPPIFDNLNGISKELAPQVVIHSPHLPDSLQHKQSYYIEKFFKKGDAKLRDKFTDKFAAYNFGIYWACVMQPGYKYYYDKNPNMIPKVGVYLSPSFGIQSDASFRILEFTKTINDDLITYDITLQITCDLYYEDKKYYGRLKNGVFKTRISLPVDE